MGADRQVQRTPAPISPQPLRRTQQADVDTQRSIAGSIKTSVPALKSLAEQSKVLSDKLFELRDIAEEKVKKFAVPALFRGSHRPRSEGEMQHRFDKLDSAIKQESIAHQACAMMPGIDTNTPRQAYLKVNSPKNDGILKAAVAKRKKRYNA